MNYKILTLLSCIALMGSAQAIVVLEDFETDMSNYSNGNGTNNNAVLSPASMHNGVNGAQFNGTGPWHYYDMGIATGSGQTIRSYVRHNAGLATGRMYMGIAYSPTHAISAVIGDNTSQIILQHHNPFGGFTTLQSVAFVVPRSTWLTLELDWAANGDFRASVWDEAGTTMLAATPIAATGITGTGGLAFRGFNGWEMDTVTSNAVPEPASLFAIGAGFAALVSRRRRRK
jgi:hypothetical protein